ncbi:3-phosphoserine/phosphohydroxythreonine transaminase [Herpetosiphon geysericola]|uniref:Phosphoserine aminotransferase n=1 Tax=Herpetosiphon geysericola TaxID=70996 RepID=A0A0P6YF69_9CHLR|nr:3-phosphoserine/phosphohydroxythreonine transaminase [Herpetosiphon geysericola]KPL88152.1 MFS transporter [Herpetosiphon geysericola]
MTVYNFNAGPAILPPTVLSQAQEELRDFAGTGISVMETSHRSKEFEAINNEVEARFKALLGIESGYRVLLLQGGASTQFAMIPLNFLAADAVADYIVTGVWAEKARDEAQKIGKVHIAADTAADKHNRIPTQAELQFSENPAYVHLTTNNTIYGTQWQTIPETNGVPIVADMSSDIFSRPFDASKFGLVYAGAQKNLGPSGVTVVLIREDWLDKGAKNVPTMLRYSTHAKNNSLYNTPPTFGVYMLNLVLGWIQEQGGLAGMAEYNTRKANIVYNTIDNSGGFYRGHAVADSRSQMNVTFNLPNQELEKQFLAETKAQGMLGLPGHRSVGGVRASIYNAMSIEGVEALASFMAHFAAKHG